LKELSATLSHLSSITAKYDGSGTPRTDGLSILPEMLSRVETFKKCVPFLSSRISRHHHRSTLERIRMDCEAHDAKGQIRQLLTSEYIDEEIRDLNRKISEAIEFVQVRLFTCTRQKADPITLAAGFCARYKRYCTP
jgi:hypothetical protein